MSQEDTLNLHASLKTLAACALVSASALWPQAAAAQQAERAELSPMSRVPHMRSQAGEDGDDRVFGGSEAAQGAYPFQVALLASNRLDQTAKSQLNAQFCGASLIAPNWVLTAGHCVVDKGVTVPAAAITALVGATVLDQGKRYEVAEVIPHPEYSESNLDNDIALLRLKESVTDVKPIDMVYAITPGGDATVIGWGRMNNGSFPSHLQEANIELTTNDACNAGIKQVYARDLSRVLATLAPRMRYTQAAVDEGTKAVAAQMNDPLTQNMLCAGTVDGVRDACNGDSGGPLFIRDGEKFVQVGIVSWGEGPMDAAAACGHANAYGVYTRLANYRDWIAGKMAN